nr:MAG TPA: hypothetical protein [Bacteriophage sp.]
MENDDRVRCTKIANSKVKNLKIKQKWRNYHVKRWYNSWRTETWRR